METVYEAVDKPDVAVAAFLASHPYDLNLFKLPAKVWVARQGDHIIAALLLKTTPYVALDLVRDETVPRPFMRIIKLWKTAEAWLKTAGVPIICASIPDHLAHYQSMVRRLGFVPIGSHPNLAGDPVETIFAKQLAPVTADAGVEQLQ